MNEPCLNDDAVLDFVGGRLPKPGRDGVERHLGDCTLCSQLVAVAAGHLEIPPARTGEALATPATEPARAGARAEALPAGTILRDTYRILRLVGRGGMGEVYEAAHARLPGRYAVKVLHRECAADPKAIVRFRREAEVTSGLRHPSIVSIIDFDSTPDGAPYLVMEYLDGTELARLIADAAPLPLDRVLRIVGEIASALGAVHRRGIVHRDLKPQNIFLVPGEGPEGCDDVRVKLVDFGISKVRMASVALTGERVLLGTPQYMAPEQALGNGEVDERADQFALAAITYEMLTGRLPFPGDRVEAVVYKIAHEDPPPLGPPWGPALGATLRRALAKDPARRFGSLAEFAASLRDAAAQDGGPLHAPLALTLAATVDAGARRAPSQEAAPTIALGRPPARRRAILGTLAVVTLVLFIAVPVRRWTQGRARAAVRTAAVPSVAATPVAPAPPIAPPPPVSAAPPSSVPAPPISSRPRKRATTARRVPAADEPATVVPAAAGGELPPPPRPQEETQVRSSKRGSLIDRL